ncbi:hypothetical protein PILCRDRAFT_814525 [Piloderma croceum F 1598]|uniref:Uncharacterized protein n=1 Tax=Piloderma croceum (strain F 1598) TaxID=765440 RepID=A0A0C3G7R6_PILCF|nr:hypothetical protein PILCRDRAFT_814525 [Piloderma croceum F 1598]
MSESDRSHRSPYNGPDRKLVISIDIGTTFTAASFCILQPGQVPKFEEILRWPKQATPDAKVPSVLYYDKHGKACAFGAETDDDETIINSETEKWYISEWWKLHLRPSHLPIIRNLSLPPLPPMKTVDDIFTDHLRYVTKQVQEYITTTYADGGNIWKTLSPTMYVILTTPNGWEGRQQNRMRQAAIKAGLLDQNGGRRVKFVTEAEAAVLYAADTGSIGDWLVEDGHLILCDCGGGTIDITGYRITSLKPMRMEESAASRCYLAGAVFVTQAARAFLEKRLSGTEWDNNDALQRAVSHFEKNAKRKFDSPETVSWIQLDGFKSVPGLGITRGRLRVSGEDMVSFFESSLKSVKEGLEIAFENGNKLADKVILVGGLASSPYMYSELVKWGEEFGISVSRPDGPTVKAVANGALAWHIDNAVTSRVSRSHYGITINVDADKDDKDQKGRKFWENYQGKQRVSDAWSGIVEKNIKIQQGKEFSKSYCVERAVDASLIHETEIYVYRRAKPPKFATFPGKKALQPGFDVICNVTADLTECAEGYPILKSLKGKEYRRIDFDICIALGETEITARMRWEENGVTREGPVTIAYE